jgi:hypothetical protein
MIEERNDMNDLRKDGWKIAAHNDYHTDEGDFTFYLLTGEIDAGLSALDVTIAIKGEGRSDAAALDAAREAAKVAREFVEHWQLLSGLGHEPELSQIRRQQRNDAKARLDALLPELQALKRQVDELKAENDRLHSLAVECLRTLGMTATADELVTKRT